MTKKLCATILVLLLTCTLALAGCGTPNNPGGDTNTPSPASDTSGKSTLSDTEEDLQAPQTQFSPFEFPENGFAINFPGKPEITESSIPFQSGYDDMVVTNYKVVTQDTDYRVDAQRYPINPVEAGLIVDLNQTFSDSFMLYADMFGVSLSPEDIVYGETSNYPSASCSFALGDPSDPLYLYLKCVYKDNLFYKITAFATEGDTPREFVESFRLL